MSPRDKHKLAHWVGSLVGRGVETEIFHRNSKLSDQYGPVFTVHLGPRRVVVLYGYEAVKEALVDHAEEFSGRGHLATVDDFVQGFGIAFANGERWRQLRRFTLSTLRNFGMGRRSIEERIQEEAHFLVEEFRKTNGSAFDPTFFLSRSVSNVICSIVFGQRFDYQDKDFLTLLAKINENFVGMSAASDVALSNLFGADVAGHRGHQQENEVILWAQYKLDRHTQSQRRAFHHRLYEMFSWIMKFLPGSHQQLFRNLNDICNFVAERVKVNKASLDHNNPRDFIDCFLIQMEKESQNPSSEFHLKTMVMTVLNLFIAGTETVSSTLRWGFLILMKYPEVQAKVFREIDDVIGKNRVPAVENRALMPYTDAVIHEIQRFSDVIPMNLPHALTKTMQFRGYTLPKGTNVFPLLTSVLRDPSSFSDPEEFNPGHFLDEDGRFKKNEAFMPFSTGKRICAGAGLARMELFIFLTSLLQNFTLRSPVDPEDLDLTPPVRGFANIPPTYQLRALPR
ncbi:UNVERIFIED_CONTAM: hypothetical protein K2H54_037493 [Gekko kuhli]